MLVSKTTIHYVSQSIWFCQIHSTKWYCCLGSSSEPLIMPHSAQMDDNKGSDITKHMQKHRSDWKCYPERRFPRAGCRRTTHHSPRCRHSRKYSQETSTWLADEPAGGRGVIERTVWTVFPCFQSLNKYMFYKELFFIYFFVVVKSNVFPQMRKQQWAGTFPGN